MGSNPDNILFVFLGKFCRFNFHCSGSKFNLLPVLFNNPSGTGYRLFTHFFPEPAAGSLATSRNVATVKSLNCCYNYRCVSGILLFFHQAPQVQKESGAKERKILKILKNNFGQFHKFNYDNSQLQATSYGLSNLCRISFLLPRS